LQLMKLGLSLIFPARFNILSWSQVEEPELEVCPGMKWHSNGLLTISDTKDTLSFSEILHKWPMAAKMTEMTDQ
jgi:hypothetical protein